jgi:hypothetical protein
MITGIVNILLKRCGETKSLSGQTSWEAHHRRFYAAERLESQGK